MGIIVYGPAGCGKSHNAEALRAHYGLTGVMHEWDGGQHQLKAFAGALVLTTANLDGVTFRHFRVVSFDEAMREAGLPNNFRYGRKWCPSDWMDEMPPALGNSPDEFLKRNDQGVLQLFPIDGADEDPEDIAWQVRDVRDGDVILFMWHERRGSRVMTIQADGSWALDEPFASDTNCFNDENGDIEYVVNTLDEAASEVHAAMMSVAAIFPVEVRIDGWTWSDDEAFRVRALESGAAHFEKVSQEGPFQPRVAPWMQACFGAEIAADTIERNHRFLEEAIELVQACGATRSEAHQLVDYVFDRPVGDKWQEVGGVMVTLAALCLAQGLDMHALGERELLRIWTMVEKIRAKQAAKPKHSPLPEHVAPVDPVGAAMASLSDEQKGRLLG